MPIMYKSSMIMRMAAKPMPKPLFLLHPLRPINPPPPTSKATTTITSIVFIPRPYPTFSHDPNSVSLPAIKFGRQNQRLGSETFGIMSERGKIHL
jgi:hypothetical protein